MRVQQMTVDMHCLGLHDLTHGEDSKSISEGLSAPRRSRLGLGRELSGELCALWLAKSLSGGQVDSS